ncbi:Kinase, NEK [Giardia duodenalis ATCC 50581]|uniref:Kinase, NEK n=1 Tax=Giardia intestinalis (strain ATCC 50581 / GS clone H7) TaxID=598745 RepID=C6LVA6_GIAIB|nr:Kinase, NEK [Giardia intestinalis ATCC 50581]
MDPVAVVSSGPRWISYAVRDVLTVEAPLTHLSQDERDALAAGIVTLLDFHHDNISRYTLVFSNENCIYFQLERYQWTLRDLLDEHRRMRQPIALGVTFSVLLGVTKALEYFHSKNIIHCHVAPELIVLDNGICLAGYELHLINRHKERNTRIDIWGLAAVVYELSTLQELQLPRHPIQRTLDNALSQLDKISDPQLRAFLRQMLTLDHINVRELIEPLEKHLQSHPEYAWYPTLDELGSKWLSPTNGTIKSIHQSLSFTKAEATSMFPDLHAAISAFVHHGSRWVRQYAVAVLAHIEEAGDGRAILSLLESKHNGKYILTTERAALIHIFAEKEGDRLLDSGYTRGYIRALAGLPTADLEVQPDGWNSWFRYAEQGNIRCMENLFDCAKARLHVDLVRNYITRTGSTALMIASILNYVRAAKALASFEHSILDLQSTKSALMIAVEYGHVDIVQILAEFEARLQTSDGKTALMLAANCNNLGAAKVLSTYEAGMQDKTGTTALMQAARYGHLDLIKVLAIREAGIQNYYGQTALMIAARYNHQSIIDHLLSSEVAIQSTSHYTLLMAAAEGGNVELVQKFISGYKGQQDKEGMTAMMYAARRDHDKIVEALLQDESRMQNNTGDTALILAAKFNCAKAATLLAPFEKGVRNSTGETARACAIRKSFQQIVELLQEYSEESEE